MAGSRVRLAVGLDAGSAYTRCVVCVVEDGKIRFLGSGEVESKGWTKSRIADRDVMSECIRQAAREAERQAQISFDDIPIDQAVRDGALEHIAQLETFYSRITGCHVVIAQPHRHHREGRLYSVRVDVRVPGGEIVVNREHHLDHAHEDD